MSKLLAVAFGALFIVGVGCHHDNKDMDDHHHMNSSDSKAMKSSAMMDDCPHCAGVQHANADGKCPECGMKVK